MQKNVVGSFHGGIETTHLIKIKLKEPLYTLEKN
jgi:hypothetical protein